MAELKFYPLEVSYKVVRDKPVLHLYGTTIEKERICVTDDSFEPYLFIILNGQLDLEKLSSLSVKPKKIERQRKVLLGKIVDCAKIYASLPEEIPKLRDELRSLRIVCHEADILFARRYLIDLGIVPGTLCNVSGSFIDDRSRVPVFKAEKIFPLAGGFHSDTSMIAVDIETLNPFGRVIAPREQPIVMLSLYGMGVQTVLTWKKFNCSLGFVEFVEDESALLRRFREIIAEKNPEVLAGYNSDGFDLPYIKTRCEKNRIALDIGLDFSTIRLAKGTLSAAEIRGIVHLDVFKFVRNIVGRTKNLSSMSLNNVAREFLGEQKTPVDIQRLFEVWESGSDELGTFCEYNLKDADITYRLAEKLLPSINEFVRITGLQITDVTRLSFSQVVEWYLLKEANKFNQLAPNKPSGDELRLRQRQTYSGGFVYEPKPGLYDKIVVFDFRSLYPSIISAHNISPDTLNCECCSDTEKVPDEQYWFCKKRKGFIASLVEDVIVKRVAVKEELKKNKKDAVLAARAEALKLVANSMYGYLGFFGARWYSLECARSITAYGRFHIQQVITKAKNEAFNVLYSDTDSIFLALEGKSRHSAELFVESINAELPGLMELDYEGYYPAGIFVSAKASGSGAKKKYALLAEDGTIKIRGFEAVRRNLSLIAREVQETVIKIILKEKDLDKALKYVQATITDLRRKKTPLKKVIITTQLTKDISGYDSIGPHVAVAQRMHNAGKEMHPGSIIQYVVIEGKEKIRERARMPHEVKEGSYDADYYIAHQVLPVVEKIFEVLGYNADDLDERQQSKLSSFFT